MSAKIVLAVTLVIALSIAVLSVAVTGNKETMYADQNENREAERAITYATINSENQAPTLSTPAIASFPEVTETNPLVTENAANLTVPLDANVSVVTFKTGELKLTKTLQINSNTLVLGEKGSVLQFFGNSYLNLTGDNITVYGLTIIGDGLNDEYGIRAKGDFITVTNSTVINIGLPGSFGFGITYEFGNEFGIVNGNVVKNAGLDGIHLRGNTNSTVSNNTILNSNDDGIASILGANNLIMNNIVNRDGTKNLSGNGIFVADKGTAIDGNLVENTPLNGIHVASFQGYQTSQISVARNTVLNAGNSAVGFRSDGILLSYVDDCQVVGNTVSGALYDGIRVYNSSRNSVVNNVIQNDFRAANGWGGDIVVEYQSLFNLISGNQVFLGGELFAFAETGSGVDYNTVVFANFPAAEIHIEGNNTIGIIK